MRTCGWPKALPKALVAPNALVVAAPNAGVACAGCAPNPATHPPKQSGSEVSRNQARCHNDPRHLKPHARVRALPDKPAPNILGWLLVDQCRPLKNAAATATTAAGYVAVRAPGSARNEQSAGPSRLTRLANKCAKTNGHKCFRLS
jgi:hypothetical protein